VDLDHPHCLVFLREDCQHVTDFFRGRGVAVLSMRELFDYVTDPALGLDEARWEEHLDRLSEAAAQRPEQTDEEKLSEAVFKGAFIPRDLSQVGRRPTRLPAVLGRATPASCAHTARLT